MTGKQDLVEVSLESCDLVKHVKLPCYPEILRASQEKLHGLVAADSCWLSAALAAECTQRSSRR